MRARYEFRVRHFKRAGKEIIPIGRRAAGKRLLARTRINYGKIAREARRDPGRYKYWKGL